MSARLGYSIQHRKSRSSRAGLLFPVGRIHRLCRKEVPGFSRMGKFAPVYLTAVLEYLTAEVLEQAGIISKMLQCDRVTPQHIRLAIREDSELDKLVPGTVFAFSGGGKMKELCSQTTVLELKGLAQEDHVSSHSSAKDLAKTTSKGKKKKRVLESYSDDDEEDYLKPVDSSFQRKALKGSKKKKPIREVFSLSQEDKSKKAKKKENNSISRRITAVETCRNNQYANDEEVDGNLDWIQEVSSEPAKDRTYPEEVTIMSSAGDFSSFSLYVSNDDNNNDESRFRNVQMIPTHTGPDEDRLGGQVKKRLDLKKGKGGQSKLFFE